MNNSTPESNNNNSDYLNKGLGKDYLLNPSLHLVNELLETILLQENKDIKIKPNEFRYSTGKGIQNIGFLKVKINKNIVIELGQKIEISIDGTIENKLGSQEKFTLFFYMLRNDESKTSSYNIKEKTVDPHSFIIQLDDTQDKLSDSVFDLTLYEKGQEIQNNNLGKGRGFLKFGLQQFSGAS